MTYEDQRGQELAIVGGKQKMRMLDDPIGDRDEAIAYARRLKRALQDRPASAKFSGSKSRPQEGVEVRSCSAVRVDRLPPTARNRPA